MKPLTIEELKALEIDDWVWVKLLDENRAAYFYKSKYSDDEEFIAQTAYLGIEKEYSDYGTKWIAYKNKEQAESKGELYQTAFELILQDVYENRLKADMLSCSSCPFMFELFDECQNQGLYEDCKKRWEEYYLKRAERRLAELKGEKK